MISGFNTDIEFDGVVYHVQTEDKGVSARVIMTLVYDGGTILASKRAPYDDLGSDDFDESVVADRLGRQHKLICAAVRAGRIDDLKKMSRKAGQATVVETAGSSAGKMSASVSVNGIGISSEVPIAPPIGVPVTIGQVETQRVISVTSPTDLGRNFDIETAPETEDADLPPIEIPASLASAGVGLVENSPSAIEEDSIFEDVKIVEDEVFLDAAAVEVVSELSGTQRPINEKLSLELLSEAKFKGGDRTTVNIMVCRGTARKVVSSAQIMIKVLGSTFRPVIFHAKTDSNGLANVHLQLPHFRAGRAALLVRAITDGEEIELRRIVTPG